VSVPNFFIIGAAKAGTTALYWHLAEHPQVFMAEIKETNFFAYEPDERGRPVYGDPRLHHFPVRSLREYEALFARAHASAVGEASPIYLEAPSAAARIQSMCPHARIICALRHPVERAYSDYLMFLRNQGMSFEPQRDFSPEAEWLQPGSHWMRTSCYHEPLQRYFAVFPRRQIHVLLFDDLCRDPLATVQGIYRFLGVADDFVPNLETPHNVGGLPAHMWLERLFHLGANVRRRLEPLLPRRFTDGLRRLRAANMQRAPQLPAELQARLTEHFADDIERTSRLIGRPLDAWLARIYLRRRAGDAESAAARV